MPSFTYTAPAHGKSYLSGLPQDKRRPDDSCCMKVNSLTHDMEVQEIVPNIFWEAGMNIVHAIIIFAIITKSEKVFLESTLGFMFHHIIEKHDTERRNRLTVAIGGQHIIEIEGHPGSTMQNECPFCYTLHLRQGPIENCLEIYGPYVVQSLNKESLNFKNYRAMIIGHNCLLGLHKQAAIDFLNLGITYEKEQVSCNTREGIEQMMKIRINLLGANSNMPIIIEFPMDPIHPSTDRLGLYIHTLCHIQRQYKGPIILVIPPYIPQKYCSEETYIEGKRIHQEVFQFGVNLGQSFGLAVSRIHIQNEDSPGNITLTDLKWSKEALFNREGERTREYHNRVLLSLNRLVKAVEYWNTAHFQRENAVGVRSLDPSEVEARE